MVYCSAVNEEIKTRSANLGDAERIHALIRGLSDALVPRAMGNVVENIDRFLVAERDGEIMGYAYASAFKERAAYAWAVETSIYIRTDAKHLGLGKLLYTALEGALKLQNITNVNACIAHPTVPDEYLTLNSEQFHEHLGYRVVGRFTGCAYKFGRWYDMVWMEKLIGEHTADQQQPQF